MKHYQIIFISSQIFYFQKHSLNQEGLREVNFLLN